MYREYGAKKASHVLVVFYEWHNLAEAIPLLAMPTCCCEQWRRLELLRSGDGRPCSLANARELLPFRQGREASQAAENELASARLLQLRSLIRGQCILPTP